MSPLQGLGKMFDLIPRALPWAVIFCPFRARKRWVGDWLPGAYAARLRTSAPLGLEEGGGGDCDPGLKTGAIICRPAGA